MRPSQQLSASDREKLPKLQSSAKMDAKAVAVVALESGPAAAGADPGAASAAAQKRPMNAFLIFCKRHRSVVKSKYPHLENRSITKILGEWWAALDADQKQTYTELARQYKEAFMKANPNFKWYKTDTFPSHPPPQQLHQHRPAPMQSPPRSDSPPTTGGTAAGGVAASSASSSSSAAAPPSLLLSSRGDHQQSLSGQKENIAIMAATAAATASSPVHSTPKPPKKRYLENSEFRALNASTTVSVAAPPAPQAGAAVTANHSSTNHHPVTTSTTAKDKSSSFPAAGHPHNQSNNQNHHPGSNSHTASHPLPVPVLDVETMNRVIVDALSSNGPNPSPSTYTNGMFETKASRSEQLNSSEQAGRGRSSPADQPEAGHVTANGVPPITSESVASLTAASLLNAESQLPIGSATKAIASAKSAAAASTAASAVSGIVSVTTSISVPPPTPPEDKPLNLSSSKVLHASNQQIIDHFIDKLLSSGGECGEGNPMPAEMLASNCVNSSNSSSSSHSVAKGSAGNGGGSRKDRSCKGKRYLEMISESKGGANGPKRPKSNSMSSGTSYEATESSPCKSSSGNSSKWVSGGFDLEERIAALPQLQDTHLVNALNNNRTRNSVNGKNFPLHNGATDEGSSRKNSGSSDDAGIGDESPHRHPSPQSAPLSPPHPIPALNGSGDAKSTNHYVNNNNSSNGGSEKVTAGRRVGDDKANSSPASSISTVCSGDEGDGDSRSSPVLKRSTAASPTPSSPRAATDGSAAVLTVSESGRACGGTSSPRQFLSSNFSLSRSQGLEVGPCDGLAALAEVALSQASAHPIATSSSS